MSVRAYLHIIRPANVITAVADVLAGMAISGLFLSFKGSQLPWLEMALLAFSTMCLYAGGIVFNDVFDLESDKINRPERVIPRGAISRKQASIFGTTLLLAGVLTALKVSITSGLLALSIAICALIYDKWAKHHQFLGPLAMGSCRGLNLILGMSILLPIPNNYFLIGLLPIIFIAAITLTAQKETSGKNKSTIKLAMFLDFIIVIGFMLMANFFDYKIIQGLVFIAFWYGLNAWAKYQAIKKNEPAKIMQAVKIGVLSLIPLNAAYAAGFANLYMAIIILALLPVSLYLSKQFQVT